MNRNNCEFLRSYGYSSELPPSEKTEIAFSGRSNVGKSSLINKIMNRKNLARVSGVPGKTATINFYKADKIILADLPGYGYAKTSKSDKKRWTELINGYFSADREIALVFELIDMRHAPSKEDIQMINAMIDSEIPFVIVLTKSDKLSKREREERLRGFSGEIPCFDEIKHIPFSAVTGEGAEEIIGIISEFNDCEKNEKD